MIKNIYTIIIFNLYFKDLADGEWDILNSRNPEWNEVDLRDNRYDQIIHLVIYFEI